MSAVTDRPLAGIAWAALAVLTASMLLALPKSAGGDISPFQFTLLRYLTGLATIAPFYFRAKAGLPEYDTKGRGRHTFKLHAVRAALAVIRITCLFYAVTHMPFANAQAITLTNGVFMIVFAVLLLRERARPATLVACAVCFAGGVIAAEPKWQVQGFLSSGAIAALAGAAIWGIESTVIKYTAVRDETVRILFTVNLIAAGLIAIPGIIAWTPLSWTQWAMLLFIGPLAIMTQVFNVKAFRVADANLLAPVRYSSVVFALLIGWFIFGEWPTVWGGMGIMLILVSGLALTLNVSGYPRRPV